MSYSRVGAPSGNVPEAGVDISAESGEQPNTIKVPMSNDRFTMQKEFELAMNRAESRWTQKLWTGFLVFLCLSLSVALFLSIYYGVADGKCSKDLREARERIHSLQRQQMMRKAPPPPHLMGNQAAALSDEQSLNCDAQVSRLKREVKVEHDKRLQAVQDAKELLANVDSCDDQLEEAEDEADELENEIKEVEEEADAYGDLDCPECACEGDGDGTVGVSAAVAIVSQSAAVAASCPKCTECPLCPVASASLCPFSTPFADSGVAQRCPNCPHCWKKCPAAPAGREPCEECAEPASPDAAAASPSAPCLGQSFRPKPGMLATSRYGKNGIQPFVLLAMGHSGTHYISKLLNLHPDILMQDEVLNASRWTKKAGERPQGCADIAGDLTDEPPQDIRDHISLYETFTCAHGLKNGVDMFKLRQKVPPEGFLNQMWNKIDYTWGSHPGEHFVGFKILREQMSEADKMQYIFRDPLVKVIVLVRENAMDNYLSGKESTTGGGRTWNSLVNVAEGKAHENHVHKVIKVKVDVDDFIKYAVGRQRMFNLWTKEMIKYGKAAYYASYEMISDARECQNEMHGVVSYIGAELNDDIMKSYSMEQIEAESYTRTFTADVPMQDKISNYQEVLKALTKYDKKNNTTYTAYLEH